MQRLEEGCEVKRGNSWKIQRDVILIRPVREQVNIGSKRTIANFKKEGKLLSKIKLIKENVQYVQSPLRETFSPNLLTP